MSLADRAVSGVKWNGVAVGTTVVLQLATTTILARILTPEDFGFVSMAVVVTGFAQTFAGLGIANAIIQKQDSTRDQLSSLYWLNLLVGITIYVSIWLMSPIIASFYQEPELVSVLRWSAGSLLIVSFGQQFQSLLRKDLRFKEYSLIRVVGNIVSAVSAIGFALSGLGAMSIVWAALLRAGIETLLLLGIAYRSSWFPGYHFRYLDIKPYIRFGLFQMGEQSLNYWSSNVDFLVVGRLLGTEALGYYSFAYNIIRVPLSGINPIIVSVAFPSFSRVQNRNDLLRWGYGKILQYLSILTLPLMIGILVLAPVLIPAVLGDNWLPAVPIIQIFCLLGVIKSLGNPLGSILLAKGKPDWGFYLNAFALVGYAVANIVGANWGAIGVAMGSLLFASIVMTPVDLLIRWRLIQMSLSENWRAIQSAVMASGLMAIVLLMLRLWGISLEEPLLGAFFQITLGASVYVGALIVLDRPLVVEVLRHVQGTTVKGS